MRVILFFLFFSLTQSYFYYNNYRLKYPNYIIKKAKFRKDLTSINHELAKKASNLWYDELKIKHIISNNQNIHLFYKENNKYYNETNVKDYDAFMYDVEMNYYDNKYLLWKPSIKPLMIKDGNEDSSILYPSYREALSIISYKDNKNENQILINNFITSPYIRSGENTDINREIKKILINYFVGYLKYGKIMFKNE